MNIRHIIISVSIAFFITFVPLIVLQHFGTHEITPQETQHNFYTQKFNPELKKIYVVGSSQVGELNVTRINENISKHIPNYTVYNLAIGADSPSERNVELSYLISTHPVIVFYGISYRDFESGTNTKYPLPDPKEYYDQIFSLDKLGEQPINPKFITLQAIRDTFNYASIFPPEKKVYAPNTPFYFYSSEVISIKNDFQLKKYVENLEHVEINSVSNNKELISLKEIITELQKNKIKVVVFSTPLPRVYLDTLSNSTKENFNLILKDISNEPNVRIYDFTNKYEDLPIWADLGHVAYNEKSMIYSDDISKIILNEMEY